jgi:hypothetical protein
MMDEEIRQGLILDCVRLAQQVIEEEVAGRRGDVQISGAREKALQDLLYMSPDASLRQIIDFLRDLYRDSSAQPKARRRIAQLLLSWAARRDMAFSDAVEAAYTLYRMSPRGSEEKRQAIEMLLEQARWPDVTMAQSIEATMALCMASPLRSEERKRAIVNLLRLAQRPCLTVEDILTFVTLDSELIIMTIASTQALVKQQLDLKKQLLVALTQRPDLTPRQSAQIAEALTALGY